LQMGQALWIKIFWDSDAEGHIQLMFWNLFPFDCHISKGERIGQGIFKKVLFTDDDHAEGERKGGMGSTGD
jgi:dUTP pyrophosphatase